MTIFCLYWFDRDNPDVDVYGANLFNRYLQKKLAKHAAKIHKTALRHGTEISSSVDTASDSLQSPDDSTEVDSREHIGAHSCASILVSTGVYQNTAKPTLHLDHMHRDFIMDPELRKPTMEATDVMEAVQRVFENESMITWYWLSRLSVHKYVCCYYVYEWFANICWCLGSYVQYLYLSRC